MKKKILTIIIATLMVMPTLGGCFAKKVPNDEKTLEIELYRGGYGSEFLDNIATAYKAKNPGVEIYINATSEEKLIRTHLPSGPNNNTVDLYLQGDSFFDLAYETGGVEFNGVKYENKLEDLTDVYNAVIPGENITVKEKMFDDYEKYHNVGTDGKDKYYQFPWASGIGGLTYNHKMFEANGWEVPTTTNDLFLLAQEISDKNLKWDNKKIYPFLFTLNDSYWDMAFMTWWAQYDTVEGFNNFYQGKYFDEESQTYKFGYNMMLSKGKDEALRMLDRILCIDKPNSEWKNDSAYTDPDSVNSYMQVQTKYFMGGSAMMPNGDWLENEIRADFEEEITSGKLDIRFMPLPIISSLGEKLNITETQLKTAVKYIRSGKTLPKPELTDKVLKEVENATLINQTLGTNHNAAIPCYAKAKNLAKDFLIFMASDEANRIYMETTKGAVMPFDFDVKKEACYPSLSNFQKTKFENMNNSKFVFHQSKNPLFYKGGISPYSNLKVSPEANLFNATNYKNSHKIHQDNYEYIYKNWGTILRNSGIQI